MGGTLSLAPVVLVALGAALFFGEVVVSAWERRPLHKWKDTLQAVAMQATTGFVSHFGKLFLLAVYVPVYEHTAIFRWDGSILSWTLAFLGYELGAYVFHRASHRTNLGWAIHVVHHQSEQLNLATAIRTAPLRSLVDWPTILPLAVLGVPPAVMGVLYLQHVAGQYWIHVQWLRRLGPLEWILNTPSHHRVHHGCQRGYQDCNYGASLILWDRLFGTFVEEAEAPIYGVVRPAPGWDPLRAIVRPFQDVREASRAWRPWDRVRVWWKPPGWAPGVVDPVRADPPPRRTDLRPLSLRSTVVHTLATSLLLLSIPMQRDALAMIVFAIHGLWSMRVQGRLLDDEVPSRASEIVRAALLGASAILVPSPARWLLPGVGAAVLLTTLMSDRSPLSMPAPRTGSRSA